MRSPYLDTTSYRERGTNMMYLKFSAIISKESIFKLLARSCATYVPTFKRTNQHVSPRETQGDKDYRKFISIFWLNKRVPADTSLDSGYGRQEA